MKLTPIDIAHKTFSKKMMGLDADEVMDYLQDVAEFVETLVREKNQLKEALREKEVTLIEYRERDESLRSTIATASHMAEKLRADGEREAKLIIADANQKAETIVRDARESLKKAYQDIADLKRARLQLETNMRALAQSHLALLDQGDRFLAQPDVGAGVGASTNNTNQGSHQRTSPPISPLANP